MYRRVDQKSSVLLQPCGLLALTLDLCYRLMLPTGVEHCYECDSMCICMNVEGIRLQDVDKLVPLKKEN